MLHDLWISLISFFVECSCSAATSSFNDHLLDKCQLKVKYATFKQTGIGMRTWSLWLNRRTVLSKIIDIFCFTHPKCIIQFCPYLHRLWIRRNVSSFRSKNVLHVLFPKRLFLTCLLLWGLFKTSSHFQYYYANSACKIILRIPQLWYALDLRIEDSFVGL